MLDYQHFMKLALEIGQGWRGRTSPNPNVGAVVVSAGGEVLGKGFTQPPGGPHAEVMALRQAGAAARGATLYVTLEPCNRQGRTPPCTGAIIGAGISEVHYAVADPNPTMLGGAETLNQAGIRVFSGECAEEAAEEHEAFFKWLQTGLPFVTLKYAMTLDGKIATRNGDSKWITGEEARLEVHRLRDDSDVILVGAGTVLADNPALTTRLSPEEQARRGKTARSPLRVVLDSQGRVPLSAQIFSGELEGQTLLATTGRIDPNKRAILEKRGIETLILPEDAGGRVALPALLTELGKRGLGRVMVEGGAEVLGSFVAQGLADKLWAFIAPKIVGGQTAPGPVGGAGVNLMSEALKLERVKIAQFGPDILVSGYFKNIYKDEQDGQDKF